MPKPGLGKISRGFAIIARKTSALGVHSSFSSSNLQLVTYSGFGDEISGSDRVRLDLAA